MTQVDMFEALENEPKEDISQDRIAAKFAAFHLENPWVYKRLRDLALKMRRSGKTHYGIGGLYEILRYEMVLGSTDEEGFKLNNNFRALYARELAKNEPELIDFFEFRLRRATGNQRLDPEVDAWDQPITINRK